MFQQQDKKFQKLEFCNDMFKQIFEVEMHLVRLNRHKYLFTILNLSDSMLFFTSDFELLGRVSIWGVKITFISCDPKSMRKGGNACGKKIIKVN